MNNEEKQKALDAVMKALNKKFGDRAITKLDKDIFTPVPVNPTGIIGLDFITGVGGIPRGRITEIFGPEGVGKTTLCYEILAETQRNGGMVLFIDAENSCDPEYAKILGADFDKMIFSQPGSGEEAFEIIATTIQTNAIDMVIVDSAAALTPLNELDDDDIAGQKPLGLQARMMSQALRNLASTLRKSNASLIFTNQLRAKIGPMGGSLTTPAGNALKFYAKMRLDMRRTESLGKPPKSYGHKVRIRTVKNNLARPYRDWEGQLIWGKGFDKFADIVWTARHLDIITLSGPYYKFEGEQISLGYDNAIETVKSDQKLYEKLKNAIMSKLNTTTVPLSDAEEKQGSDDEIQGEAETIQ